MLVPLKNTQQQIRTIKQHLRNVNKEFQTLPQHDVYLLLDMNIFERLQPVKIKFQLLHVQYSLI